MPAAPLTHVFLARAGRSCWKLVNGLSAVEDPSNERARPGARLQARTRFRCCSRCLAISHSALPPQALLLMGMLFCVGKDGNRAAGKMLNRCASSHASVALLCFSSLLFFPSLRSFDIARHVAAVLSASFKAPDGRYLGVKWSPFEAVLYVRVLAENEDFTDRLVSLAHRFNVVDSEARLSWRITDAHLLLFRSLRLGRTACWLSCWPPAPWARRRCCTPLWRVCTWRVATLRA